ncbi:MFS transporter [Nevskia soli]|uniref:MFS transporter n=1 Tax=Nevskia soli TaxID=418856 RepID=UPI000A02264F|nr:MFS transporter [Nevskia soli]
MSPTDQTGAAVVADTNRAANRGLDWFNLCVANIQTGFGPFVAVYLVSQGWTQTAIGIALSIGTVTAMASQVPAGALVDALRSKATVAFISVLAFTASALMFAIYPIPLFVYLAEILHGFSSCTLGPAVAAMSLALAGRAAMGTRLGRNARYASIGNGVGAALMGACGSYVSERAVFFLTAIVTLPAVFALLPLRGVGSKVVAEKLEPAAVAKPAGSKYAAVMQVLLDRRLLIFSACAMLFTFANAPMLPLAASTLTTKVGHLASLLIGACIVLPQVIVALASPAVGRIADLRGRRPLLLLGFCMLPLRGLLFATLPSPTLVVAIQALDGVAAACFGIMVPLITSDVAGRSGHYTLSLGVVGFAIGIGATVSTTAAGWVADHFGSQIAFLALAGVGLAATLLLLTLMPETRPPQTPGVPAPGTGPGVGPASRLGMAAKQAAPIKAQ